MMKDDFLQCFKMFETIYQAYLADSSNPDASPLYLMDCLLNLSTRLGDTSSFFKYALAQYDILSKMNDVPQEYFIECQNSIVVGQLRCRQLDGIDDMLNKIESFYREQYGEVSNKYATYLHNRGYAYQLQNKLDEAKATLLKAISIQNKIEGKPFEKTVKYYMEVEQALGEL